MAQKIQFIAAVLNRPELLILDEPFSGLDPVNAEVLKDAVLDLKKAGTTVVFSTHDMSVAERLCDRIFMIFKGPQGPRRHARRDPVGLRSRHDPAADRGGAWTRLDGLDGIDEVNDQGNLQEVTLAGRSAGPARGPDRPDPDLSTSRSPGRRCTTSSSGSPRRRPARADRAGGRRPMRPDLRKIGVVAVDRVRLGDPHQVVPHRPACCCRSSWGGRSCCNSFVAKRVDTRPRTVRRHRPHGRSLPGDREGGRGLQRPGGRPERARRSGRGSSSVAGRRADADDSLVAGALRPDPPRRARRLRRDPGRRDRAAGAGYAKPPAMEYHSDNPNDDVVRNWLVETVNAEVRSAAVPRRPGIDRRARRPAEPAGGARQPRPGRRASRHRRPGAPRSRRPRRSTRSAPRSSPPC